MSSMYKVGAAFLAGFVFALGLGISGMTDTTKVIGFLTLGENWNPALMLVMGGAIAVHFVFYKIVTQRQFPLFDEMFHIPTRTDISGRLIIGSILFGLGWGMGGICPGPGIISLTSGHTDVLVFIASMIVGAVLWQQVERRL